MQRKDGIKISIGLEMPTPEVTKKAPVCKKASVEDKVREALECIESGEDSSLEWMIINKVYKALKCKKKLSQRGKNIMKLIEPVLAHYGYHDVSSNNAK